MENRFHSLYACEVKLHSTFHSIGWENYSNYIRCGIFLLLHDNHKQFLSSYHQQLDVLFTSRDHFIRRTLHNDWYLYKVWVVSFSLIRSRTISFLFLKNCVSLNSTIGRLCFWVLVMCDCGFCDWFFYCWTLKLTHERISMEINQLAALFKIIGSCYGGFLCDDERWCDFQMSNELTLQSTSF